MNDGLMIFIYNWIFVLLLNLITIESQCKMYVQGTIQSLEGYCITFRTGLVSFAFLLMFEYS